MNSIRYDDFKYSLQDTSNIYIGAKMSYAEIMNYDEISFKFRAIIEHYLLHETQPDTTLESEFYYMDAASFAYRTYQQLHVKLKISILVEKKTLLGKKTKVYKEETVNLSSFVQMSVSEKKQKGIVIQELIIPRFALLSFAV